MKKEIKFIALFYLGVAVFTYSLTLGVDRMSKIEAKGSTSRTMVIKLK